MSDDDNLVPIDDTDDLEDDGLVVPIDKVLEEEEALGNEEDELDDEEDLDEEEVGLDDM